MEHRAKVWAEDIELPFYEIGHTDPNPLFLEQRVYQGSSGEVYPYGVIDQLQNKKGTRRFNAVYLENDYVKIMLLPELGGRIHRAFDKINNRDFIYYNEVVKPALVGLLGPWISGGIEFNWPQHHRPTTFMPVDYRLEQRDDGAVTAWLGEVEHMYGLQVMTGITLYPDKALVEVAGKVYNGNDTPRSFLWWANPAVKAGPDHQSIFPPDVTAVYDHGKRDVSDFPIATGEYYKVNYAPGTDISRYKNIPVPTSYMAYKSDFDFVGAYCHEEQGGLLHVANHYFVPGKKQWTWGNCEFGRAWDKQLTDRNGPYIELMTGVYTDNQPDFTWLEAHEEKTFVQNFLPYCELGRVHNANTELALKLEREGDGLDWGIYAIAPLEHCQLTISAAEQTLLCREIDLLPGQAINDRCCAVPRRLLTMRVCRADGSLLLQYCEQQPGGEPVPQPATAPAAPEAVASVEELYFIGQHLEQYHHASGRAAAYYRAALARDPNHYLANVALAQLAYGAADYPAAIEYADHALLRAHQYNKNPQCGKASLIRAFAKEQLGQWQEALADATKATWSDNCAATGFYGAARIATRLERYDEALGYVEQALTIRANDQLASVLQAYLLLRLTRKTEALTVLAQTLRTHPLSYHALWLRYQITGGQSDHDAFMALVNQRAVNVVHMANFYLAIGDRDITGQLLQQCQSPAPMPLFYQAYLCTVPEQQERLLNQARDAFNEHVIFPNTLTEMAVLSSFGDDYFACYLCGCFFYAKRRYQQACQYWQRAATLAPQFAQAQRALAIYYFNHGEQQALALRCMDRAAELAPEDARIRYELDYLQQLTGMSVEQRLGILGDYLPLVRRRDDLTAQLISLYNISGDLAMAEQWLAEHIFHPWEGGEGVVTGEYVINKIRLALRCIDGQDYRTATDYLNAALTYPDNLGEGRLVGQTDNDVYFLLGYCHQQLANTEAAREAYQRASRGELALTESRYYNDQPVDYQFYRALALHQLAQPQQAQAILNGMLNWANSHINETVTTDFFAVSLPSLLVFNRDPNVEHRCHCLLVKALAELGLNIVTGAEYDHRQTLQSLLDECPAYNKGRLFSVLTESRFLFDM